MDQTRTNPSRFRQTLLVVLAALLGLAVVACRPDPLELLGIERGELPTTTSPPVDEAPGTTAPPTSAPPTSSPTSEPTPGTDTWLMGFYPVYQRDLMPIVEVPWNDLTHLAVGRVVPLANGTIDRSFDYDDTAGPEFARQLAAAAVANDVVPVLMVGGAGTHDDFAAAAARPEALARELVDTARSLGFAGLELDWEPLLETDEPLLVALAEEIREIDPELLLTMSIGWTSTTFPDVRPVYAELAAILDQLNIMSYGMAGAWDGWNSWHSSALDGASEPSGPYPSSVAVSVTSYLDAGVPANKLGVGIGFYGSCWTGGIDGPRQSLDGASIAADDNVMSYENILDRYYEPESYRYDDVADAPYLGYSSPHGPEGCTFVSYEDERSVAAKSAYVREQGLGGAIVWTINQGHLRSAPAGARDPLLRAAAAGLGV